MIMSQNWKAIGLKAWRANRYSYQFQDQPVDLELFIELFKNDFGSFRQVPVFVKDLGNFEPRDVVPRTGPGEGGKAHVLRDDQQNDVQQSESDYGMNMVCSDEISLDRSVPDTRPDESVLLL